MLIHATRTLLLSKINRHDRVKSYTISERYKHAQVSQGHTSKLGEHISFRTKKQRIEKVGGCEQLVQ